MITFSREPCFLGGAVRRKLEPETAGVTLPQTVCGSWLGGDNYRRRRISKI